MGGPADQLQRGFRYGSLGFGIRHWLSPAMVASLTKRSGVGILRVEVLVLAAAVLLGSWGVGEKLGALAARPTEFAECASLVAGWMASRELKVDYRSVLLEYCTP